MARGLAYVMAWVLLAPGASFGQSEAEQSAQASAQIAWLQAHAADPVDYVCDLLGDADLLIIGETHEVADNCEFVASLVGPAYERAGVRVLATEFLMSSLNERVHAVVTADAWDEEAAVDLFRAGPWPSWGFQEYVDILKAVWDLNDGLPQGAEPLRVVGIDADWRQIDLVTTDDRAKRFRIVQGRENHMHGVVDGLIDEPGRVLVHVGFAHCVFIGDHRMGARLRNDHGARVQHLVLHHEIRGAGGRSEITSGLDELYTALDQGPIAFGMAGSPINDLHDPDAMYARLLGPDARLSSFMEHYAILTPIDELRPVGWIPGFITEARLEEAIRVGEEVGWIERDTVRTRAEANAAFAERLAAREPENR